MHLLGLLGGLNPLSLCNALFQGFPGGLVVKNPPGKHEAQVWSLGQEGPPREGNGNPLQYSCLANSMNGGSWEQSMCRQCMGLQMSQTQPSN